MKQLSVVVPTVVATLGPTVFTTGESVLRLFFALLLGFIVELDLIVQLLRG